jgi:hypothetical protein
MLAEGAMVQGIVYMIPTIEEDRKLDVWCGTTWKPISVDITILPQGLKRGSKVVAGKTLVFAGDTTSVLTDAVLKLHLDEEDVRKLAARIQGMAETVKGQGEASNAAYGSTQARIERPSRSAVAQESKREPHQGAMTTAGKRSNAMSRRQTLPILPVAPPSQPHPAFRQRPHTCQGGGWRRNPQKRFSHLNLQRRRRRT